MTSINENVFYDCSSLTSVTLPERLMSIDAYAFYNCSSLTSITIPEVTSIGSSAFSGCNSLTSIICIATIPPVINSNVFNETNECPIYVPASSVKTYKAASGWRNYADRIRPTGPIEFVDPLVKQICVNKWDTNNDGDLSYEEAATITEIPKGLFNNKTITSFEELNYFTNLNVIREYAFSGCSNLSSITLPSGVTSIEGYAFSGCNSLTSITLPSGITTIGERAFSGCSNLTRITLPKEVTEIESYAFENCSSLRDITIPASVTSIGDFAFYNCSNLTWIYCSGKNPPTISPNVFESTNIRTIYVPDEGWLDYIAASGWSYYASLFEAESFY